MRKLNLAINKLFEIIISVGPSLIAIAGCLLSLFSSYSYSNTSSTGETTLPVFINPKVNVIGYIADASKVHTLSDQLTTPWNISVTVRKNTKENTPETKKVNSCQSTLAAYRQGFHPVNHADFTPYQYSYIQCQSIALVSNMTSPTLSYIGNIKLDKSTINRFPASVGEVISTDDQRKVNAKPLMTIREFSPITKVTQQNEYSTKTEDSSGGIQNMTIQARGDFNDDQTEDLLLSVHNQVKGGSYNTYHLYILTKTKENGPWQVITKY